MKFSLHFEEINKYASLWSMLYCDLLTMHKAGLPAMRRMNKPVTK